MTWTVVALIIVLGWWSGLSRALLDGLPLLAAALDVALILTAAALVRPAWTGHRWRKVDSVLLAAVSLYGFLAAVQMLNPNVPDLVTGLEGFRKSAFTMLAFYLAAFAATNDSLRMYRVIAVGGVVAMLWGIRQFFAPLPVEVAIVGTSDASLITFHSGAVLRAFSPTSGPFHFGILAGATALAALGLAARNRPRWWAVVVIAGLGLALSITRANLVATGLAAVVLTFVVRGPLRMRVAGMAVLAFAVLCGLGASAGVVIDPPQSAVREALETPRPGSTPPLLPQKSPTPSVDVRDLIDDLADPLADRNLQFRFAFWTDHLRAILERPITGYGTSSASDGFEERFEPRGLMHFSPHSIYLKPALELGLAGLVLFGVILGRTGQLALRGTTAGKPESVLAVSLLTLTLISGLTGPMLDAYPFNVLFWASAGTVARRSNGVGDATEQDAAA